MKMNNAIKITVLTIGVLLLGTGYILVRDTSNIGHDTEVANCDYDGIVREIHQVKQDNGIYEYSSIVYKKKNGETYIFDDDMKYKKSPYNIGDHVLVCSDEKGVAYIHNNKKIYMLTGSILKYSGVCLMAVGAIMIVTLLVIIRTRS